MQISVRNHTSKAIFLKVLSVTFFLVVVCSPSFARVGETPEQCAERYGQPVSSSTGGNEMYVKSIIKKYNYDGLEIEISYANNVAVKIEIEGPLRIFSDDKARSVLTSNTQGKKWVGPYLTEYHHVMIGKEAASNNYQVEWFRSDGGVATYWAFINVMTGVPWSTLRICSADALTAKYVQKYRQLYEQNSKSGDVSGF